MFHGLPAFLFAYFFLDFGLPATPWLTVVFVFSLFLGFLIFFAVSLLIGMLSIVTLKIDSYNWAYFSLIRFASGQFVPLWMFPPLLAAVVSFLPFKSVYFVPMSIYIGAEQEELTTLISSLWWDVPVIESLRLLKEIYKIPTAIYAANLELFNGLLDLHEFQHIPVRQLSLGQRMRSDLAAALLHNPDILFLDEPTIGVDVVAKERFRTFMRQLNHERQVTVLLTTHDMSDIEKVCDRMMIIDHGHIIYDGRVAGMKEQLAPHRTLVVDFTEEVAQVMSDKAEIVKHNGRQAHFRFDRRQISASQLIAELAPLYPIKDITVEEPEIEAIVRGIYQGAAV